MVLSRTTKIEIVGKFDVRGYSTVLVLVSAVFMELIDMLLHAREKLD